MTEPTPTIDELQAHVRNRRRTLATLREVRTRLQAEIVATEAEIAAAEDEAARRIKAVVDARTVDRVAREAHPYNPPKVDAASADDVGCGEGHG